MKKSLIILLIIAIAAFLRFYNLMFDSPYFFNPDERNMANTITQFRLPRNLQDLPSCFFTSTIHLPAVASAKVGNLPPTTCNLNPHFFAYGQFPLYLAFFSDQIVKFIIHLPSQPTTFSDAILWLRFWSATTSVLTVLLVFLISRQLFAFSRRFSRDPDTARSSGRFSLFAAALCAATPGLIQSAHFGTTESLLTFFFLALIYLAILYSSKKILTTYFLLLTTLVLGLALSTKISALLFFPVPLLAIFLSKIKLFKKFLFSFLILTSSFLILFLTSPFNLVDSPGFLGSINYESAVALGKTKVFYTRQFENTTPVLFQAQKIFPYALGLPIFIFGILGIGICLGQSASWRIRLIRNLHQEQTRILALLLFSFFIYFLPNAFLYAKWTRFMTPVFPLFSIFAVYFLYHVFSFSKRFFSNFQLPLFIIHYSLFILLALPGLAFFTIYARPDTRVQASQWIYQDIPSGSYVLSETANVVDIPVPLSSIIHHPPSTIVSFNFYDLDENPNRFEELLTHLEKAEYIFVPSRRIFANHLRLSDTYPLTSKYYGLLFSGNLGFTQVAEFTSYPSINLSAFRFPLAASLSDERSEETFTVFDHPVVRIYKKQAIYSKEDYRSLLSP